MSDSALGYLNSSGGWEISVGLQGTKISRIQPD
jgi:hypothetical protein